MGLNGLLLGLALFSAQALAMHPSWDADGDGVNDCENDDSCDHTVDYTKPRPTRSATLPSFSCAGEGLSSAEQAVCANAELAGLDLQLHEAFQALLEQADDTALESHLKAVQRGWIKGRDECWKSPPVEACVEREYRERIEALDKMSSQIGQHRLLTLLCENNPEREIIIRFYALQPALATLSWPDKASLLYRESASPLLYRGADTELRQQDEIFIINDLEPTGMSLRCESLEALEK